MLKVLYSPEAENALHEIFFYTADSWGLPQARKYMSELSEAFDIISKNPNIGNKYPEIPDKYRAFPIKKHLIIYRVEAVNIFIVAIIHMSMDVDKRLQKLLENKEI